MEESVECVYNDGGRDACGYKGTTGDCVCRAIAIATDQSYDKVYEDLINLAGSMRQTKRVRGSHPRTGVCKNVYGKYLKDLGWKWIPVMKVGIGCTMHLVKNELPPGRLIVRLSKHVCAVIDGVVYDTYDPSRNGSRCVYGYWKKEQKYSK